MIHYQLRCTHDHLFDGWFQNSAAFEKQAKRGLLECPVCGSVKVERALMAPAVTNSARAVMPMAAAGAPAPSGTVAQGHAIPAQARALLQKMRVEVEANCDYVGSDFAEEARRIHYGESEKHGIYGETSPEQAEELADEGIEITRIPWLPRSDA